MLTPGAPLPPSITKWFGKPVDEAAMLDQSILRITSGGNEVCARFLLNGDHAKLGCSKSPCRRVHVDQSGNVASLPNARRKS